MDQAKVMCYSRVSAALNYPEDIHDIKLVVKVHRVTGNTRSIDVQIAIAPGAHLSRTWGDHVGSLDVTIFAATRGRPPSATVGTLSIGP